MFFRRSTRSHSKTPLLVAAVFAMAHASACRRDPESQRAPRPRATAREEAPAGGSGGALAPVTGEGPTVRSIGEAQRAIEQRPREIRNYLQLARLFVQHARERQDPSFYAQASDALDRARDIDPDSMDAAQLRGLIHLQNHRFREARDLAQSLLIRNPHSVIAFGILSDARLELGEYDGAVEATQQMINERPDAQGYVRAAWLRWIHGQVDGAQEVMRLALDALPRSPEGRAWIITQAGVLQFNRGELRGAQEFFDAALNAYPPFAMARAGRARVALARGDFATALREAEAAAEASPTVEHEWLAGDAAEAAGRSADAERHFSAVERIGRRSDPRTLSLFLSTRNRSAEDALALARQEHRERQDIFSDDALAWALHRRGEHAAAREAITRARRTGIRDARIRFHAGMIAHALGDRAQAVENLRAALSQNPYWDRAEATEARNVLGMLGVVLPAPSTTDGGTR